jgi:hypothetical protein
MLYVGSSAMPTSGAVGNSSISRRRDKSIDNNSATRATCVVRRSSTSRVVAGNPLSGINRPPFVALAQSSHRPLHVVGSLAVDQPTGRLVTRQCAPPPALFCHQPAAVGLSAAPSVATIGNMKRRAGDKERRLIRSAGRGNGGREDEGQTPSFHRTAGQGNDGDDELFKRRRRGNFAPDFR